MESYMLQLFKRLAVYYLRLLGVLLSSSAFLWSQCKTLFSQNNNNVQHYKPYTYKPLEPEYIRVLVLCAGKPHDPLQGYLINKKLNRHQTGDYEALSYVWGDTSRTKSIILNHAHMSITQSLYDALHHLRSSTSNRKIFVDALCINQADIPERNEQVAAMGDIYSSAARVINWLGPATRDTALGMQTLRFLFGDEDITANPPWEKHSASAIRAALNDILNRTYFRRIWVLQETALASQTVLQAGRETLTWHRGAPTHRAICRIKFAVLSPSWEAAGLHDIDFRPLLEVLEQSMMVTRQKMGKPCREVTLLDLAFDMRYRRATDRRDMLFGLRNMVPEDVRGCIVVDYGKSVEEVYGGFWKAVEMAYRAEIGFVEKEEGEWREWERGEREKRGVGARRGMMGGW